MDICWKMVILLVSISSPHSFGCPQLDNKWINLISKYYPVLIHLLNYHFSAQNLSILVIIRDPNIIHL